MADTSLESQKKNKKYRNWVKAGLSLKYVKEGLELFCDDIVKQQHSEILTKVKKKHNVSSLNCDRCNLQTLQPNHVRDKSKQCPLGQINCNCQYPGGKVVCPNNVCGAIYDEIIQLHASTPPVPYWKNSDVQKWCTEPWAVANCFINAPGYRQMFTASEIDCCGLFHVLINNIDLQKHLKTVITGNDVFSRVRRYRNIIFHSNCMELEENDINMYIDDMIAALQDDKELKAREESKSSVRKLVELKNDDFIITTNHEVEVQATMAVLKSREREFEQKMQDYMHNIELKSTGVLSKIEQKGADIEAGVISEIEQKGSVIEAEVLSEIKQKGADNEAKILSKIEQKGTAIEAEVLLDIEREGSNIEVEVLSEIEQKGALIEAEILSEIEQKGADIEAKVLSEIKQKGDDIEVEVFSGMEQKGAHIENEVLMEIEQIGADVKAEVLSEIGQKGADIEAKVLSEIEQKEIQLKNELEENIDFLKEAVKRSPKKQQYAKRKKEFQTNLVNIYEDHVIKVSEIPLLPERDQTDINDVYVAPLMTLEVKSGQTKKIAIHEIFETEGKMLKNIYVLGEAGSGKSALCKSLISHWCFAHSKGKGRTKRESINKTSSFPKRRRTSISERIKSIIIRPQVEEIVKKLKAFEFLFYVSLRHSSNFSDVKMMLNDLYGELAVEVLENESSKCLILLDGLDEWTMQFQKPSQFQTKGIPSRNIRSDYTIITTSRQWKFDSLHIKDSEVSRIIKLKGIDENAIRSMSEKTVDVINDMFDREKVVEDFSRALRSSPVVDMSHIPMILQQLICLWYDDRLRGTSKCAIYSSMLNLFFEWSSLRLSESQEIQTGMEATAESNLCHVYMSDVLHSYDACCSNANIIQNLSRLAFVTLFTLNEEHRLTFPSSTFEHLNLQNDVSTYLKIGILVADQGVAFLASKRQNVSFSFIHKSIQEYLAAVYIATEFEKNAKLSSAKMELGEFVLQYFENCRTVNDILEQSNVFIMLGGLEPELARCMTEYIYNIVSADSRVLEFRTDLKNDNDKLVEDIQLCIGDCTKEAISNGKQIQPVISLGDVIIRHNSSPHDILPFLAKGIIIADNIRSLLIKDPEKWYNESAIKYLTNCTQVKTIRYKCASLDYREYATLPDTVVMKTNKVVAEIFVRNVSTLKSVTLDRVSKRLLTPLINRLPEMSQLISLQITHIKFPHEDCDTICSLLERCTQVQRLVLAIDCYQKIDHTIHLSKHTQLRCVNFFSGNVYGIDFRPENLLTCTAHAKTDEMMTQVCTNLRAATHLQHLELRGDYRSYRKTETLIILLSSLENLSTLILSYCTISENIIRRPSNMTNLKQIELWNVDIDTLTWCKFVNSLLDLPQVVHVKTGGLHSEANGQARQYVREKSTLFDVIDKDFESFEFTTKK